jgi:hypothetical protein
MEENKNIFVNGRQTSFLNRVKTKNSTSKQHRKLKFGVQSYLNPYKEIKKLKKWVTSHPPLHPPPPMRTKPE